MVAGNIIGERYRIIEELGRGSFGTTYAAEDLGQDLGQNLDSGAGPRRVAIKQLDLRRVDDWKAVELFEREARVLASLDHPRIPDYIEFVPVAADHTGYLVQELAPGTSLAARLAAGERFSESQVRDIAEQLLEVLVYLAQLVPPVVHRDIKPGNVISSLPTVNQSTKASASGREALARAENSSLPTVNQSTKASASGREALARAENSSLPTVNQSTKASASGREALARAENTGDRCYLVDFGSVRDAVEAKSTGGSTVAGTFGYMAPEQLHGEASPRSDLFGLGMTLVHLLTGTCPAELDRKRLKVDFRPHVQLSRELADFVDRLIEPIADDRFADPQAALDHLRGVSLEVASSKPSALAAGMTGASIAASVAHSQRAAEQAARRKQELDQQRTRDVAARARPRVRLVRDPEGLALTIDPTPLGFRFAVQIWLPLFLTANPGFVVAGGVPFFGQYWPVFADNGVARFVVWGLFLMSLSLLVAHLRGQRFHLRVAGEHYAAWTRDPAKPVALGPISDLSVLVHEPTGNGYGSAVLELGETTKVFTRMSSKDLEQLEQLELLG
ncbi:Protein kinase [Enhygromyxa salina]|uniref:non-specific serine/threonine protein kinase n=1 Tax=Enhygromyxa salina TaxID=215803 RepID=A0A0C2D1B6_9BACT|nr:serine/threonine-protein kinase [Enhygromyxa salina]KIG17026.1 Protein kinase [Enhygromyxa salina]